MNDTNQRGWRVGHRGRDQMFYEELIAGSWERLDIDGEMLMGRAHHVIYFASVEQWQHYPVWARHRRDEIIARIKSEFREPDYEYHEDGPGNALPTTGTVPPVTRPVPGGVTAKQRAALFTVIAILLGIAGSMGWLVVSGFNKGETFMPSKRASLQRVLSQEQEPASYWAALSVYTLIGLGCGVGAIWAIRQA